jgi:cytochrome P450
MRAEPPGPRGDPLFGNTRQYADDPFAFLTAVHEAYGDVARLDLGPMETYVVSDPAEIERVLVSEHRKFRKPDFQDDALGDLLGNGLLLSDGERWREQRELANPAFDMSRLSGLTGMMADHVEAMVSEWRDGDTLDVQLEMARVTVRIIVDAMFGATISEAQTRRVQENLEPLGARFEADPFRFVLPDWTPTRENREYRAAVAELEEVVDELIARRREAGDYAGGGNGGPPMDLLSILLRAGDAGEQTDGQIRDEMMTMLLAGHDTTALALTYTWYLLSQYPEAEARLHAELDAVVDSPVPTAADVREMEYADRVLSEAMRLYPPVYTVFRQPKVDVRLGGYRIPEGASVMLSQWIVHRSPDYWENPAVFDPDRFAPERRADRPRFAYFPFGGGPRHCIGKQLSMLEAKLILGTVATRYSLSYAREEPFDLRGSLTMHPREPMEMTLRARGRE